MSHKESAVANRIADEMARKPQSQLEVTRSQAREKDPPADLHGDKQEARMSLVAEFHQAMLEVYDAAAAHGYRATYFKRMVDSHGGVETARKLLAKQEIQTGLTTLWELGLLEYSTEAIVLKERFRPLFTEAEVQEARRRLEALGFSGK